MQGLHIVTTFAHVDVFNAYIQQSRDSVEEYIPVDLWLRAHEKFDAAAYGPIYFLQETGLWIVDANEFLMNERLFISVVTPAE